MDLMLILQIIVLLGRHLLWRPFGRHWYRLRRRYRRAGLGSRLRHDAGCDSWDVILIIMSVIAAISAMQLAGGLDYLVQIAENILRRQSEVH